MDMELKGRVWSRKDGDGVERRGIGVERLDMVLKGWIWS